MVSERNKNKRANEREKRDETTTNVNGQMSIFLRYIVVQFSNLHTQTPHTQTSICFACTNARVRKHTNSIVFVAV